jgi:8-hydroxy-5-deazaflavin:NADPH oxidoreductase
VDFLNSSRKTIAVIGGTGAEGRGLALRWAAAGHQIIIGSRDTERARATARELAAKAQAAYVQGAESADAARNAQIVALTVPYAAQLETARRIRPELEGKILVDVTVPLVPPKVSRVQLPGGQSCVVLLQNELGKGVQVVSAFQNVSAHRLSDLSHRIACDVLVCSDFKDARQAVIELARDAGMRGIDAGPLANSVAAESLTSLLIWINRAYKVPDAGVAITGLP